MFFRRATPTDPKILGRRGENAAARHLKRNGYRIIKRNYLCPAGEIDILAADGDMLVFVEVKTRARQTDSDPENSVGRRKRSKIIAAARYLLATTESDAACRFDVISIVLDDSAPRIEHFIDAFGPDGH